VPPAASRENVAKAIAHALTGYASVDDHQVVPDGGCGRYWATPDRVEVT
jgi:hypothetical protein